MKRLPALFLTLGIFAVAPTASGKPENGQVFGEWRAFCESAESGDAEDCHVFQHLVAKDTQESILHAMVLYTPKRADPVMILTLPLGVAVRAGVQVQVDAGEPRKLIFETCLPEGCRAGMLLDAKALDEFRKGAQAGVSFFNLRGKQLNLPLSLSGFTKAVSSLK